MLGMDLYFESHMLHPNGVGPSVPKVCVTHLRPNVLTYSDHSAWYYMWGGLFLGVSHAPVP